MLFALMLNHLQFLCYSFSFAENLLKILYISGRKEIIADFKSLLSSFPEAMSSMQSQLGNYKVAAVDIHSLQADVQSLSSISDRKVGTFISFMVVPGFSLRA